MRLESCLAEMLKPFVVGQLNRFDRPVKGFRALRGQAIDVQRCRPGQLVDRADVVLR